MPLPPSCPAVVCSVWLLWKDPIRQETKAREVSCQPLVALKSVLTTRQKQYGAIFQGLCLGVMVPSLADPLLGQTQLHHSLDLTKRAISLVRMVLLLVNLSSYNSSRTTTRKTTSIPTIPWQHFGRTNRAQGTSLSWSVEICLKWSESGTMAGRQVSDSQRLPSSGKHGEPYNATRA
jgi:hypothetical protein